jgi:hypothetical protein
MSVTYLPLPETWVTDAGNKLPPALQKLVIETSKQSAGQTCISIDLKKKIHQLETEIMSETPPHDTMVIASKRFPSNEPQAKKFALILSETNLQSLKLKLDNTEARISHQYSQMITITSQTFANIRVNPNLAAQSVSALYRHHLNMFVAQFTVKIEQDKLKKAIKLLKLNEKKELDASPKVLTTKEYNNLIKFKSKKVTGSKNLTGTKNAKEPKNATGSKPVKVSRSKKTNKKDPKLSKEKSTNLKPRNTAKGKTN